MEKFMDEPREEPDGEENPEEGYAVAPLPPAKEYSPPMLARIYSRISAYDFPRKKPFQYTLADMFALTTAVAVFMSIFLSILKFIPLKTIAGASGLGALLSFILLVFWTPERPLIRIGWWVLFAVYLLTCIGAIIFT
jgi:hypothetical protein